MFPWFFFLLFWSHLFTPFAGVCFQLTLGVPFPWHPVPCPWVTQ